MSSEINEKPLGSQGILRSSNERTEKPRDQADSWSNDHDQGRNKSSHSGDLRFKIVCPLPIVKDIKIDKFLKERKINIS